MPADPRDDFGVFDGHEHMFFGLVDPYRAFRGEIEDQLRKQVPDTVVERVVTHGEPQWRTIGRRRDDDPGTLIVTYWGVCFRACVAVAFGYGHEQVEATLTFLFGRWDNSEEQRVRTYFDLAGDADLGAEPARFEERFLAFRAADP